MKSSFESKKHREVRRTKEALRAHVITGRIPERVIGILIDHGCTRSSALVLMENIFTGELTVTQRGIIREISKKSPGTIPPVTPPQKPEEPKLGVPTVPQVSLKSIARGAPASTPYSDEGSVERSTIKIKFDVLFLRPTTDYVDMVEISPETLEQITMLMAYGHLDIVKHAPHSDLCIVNYQHYTSRANLEYSGRLDEVIPQLIIDLGIDTIPANPDTEVSAGRSHFSAPMTPEALPQGHVRISLGENPEKTSTGGIIVTEKTWEEIELLKKRGTLEISKSEISAIGEVFIHFYPHLQPGQVYPGSGYRNGSIDWGIHGLVEELRSYGVLPPEKTESQKPNTVRINLSKLTVCESNNPDEGVEVSLETLRRINELKTYGELTVKIHQRDQFRFRFMPRAVGGPHTSYGYTLDEAMGKLWGYLQELGIVSENPSDTVRIDIDEVQECTGTGPGVETIPRKILNDIVKLNGLGRIVIIKEDIGGFSIQYYSNGNKDSFSGQTIEEIIPHIVWMMRAIYPDRFES